MIDDLDREILGYAALQKKSIPISQLLKPFANRRVFGCLHVRFKEMERQELLKTKKGRRYVLVRITEKGRAEIQKVGSPRVLQTATNDTSLALLQELKQIAPDIWDGKKRCLILPQKLGDLDKPEYVEGLQNVIRRLHEFMNRLNAELISEADYERWKAEILSDFGVVIGRSHLEIFDSKEMRSYGV
jgi:DNA-binding MarR family transcriptional regulator